MNRLTLSVVGSMGQANLQTGGVQKIQVVKEPLAEGGSRSLRKLAEDKPGIGIFYTPAKSRPGCNIRCAHCYYFANYNDGAAVIPASEMPALLKAFRAQGYEKFYTITSELLMSQNWRDILKAAGDDYVNTNGILIVRRGQQLLQEMMDAGVIQIIITANVSDSHDVLKFASKQDVETAFAEIARFNNAKANGAKPKLEERFSTVATVVLTSDNFDKIFDMCEFARVTYRVDIVKFVALIPFSDSLKGLSPTLEQLHISTRMINEARRKYGRGKFYVQRGGTLGTQNLDPRKLDSVCPAGNRMFFVRSMAEGSSVVPCIYTPSTVVGTILGGKVVFDGRLQAFLDLKSRLLASGYCPAHAMANKGPVPDFVLAEI